MAEVAALSILLVCLFIWPWLKRQVSPINLAEPQSRHLSADLPYPRDAVWQAMFAHTRFRGRIEHIGMARAGDVIDFETIVGTGSCSQITRITARVLELEHGRRYRIEVLTQDGEPFIGGEGCWNAYELEDTAVGTRLTETLHVRPRNALERYFMRKALETDMAKIKARLEEADAGVAVRATA
jgi:hypothetical protein